VIQIAAALASLAVAFGLWVERSWARRVVVAIAGINIGVIFFTQFEGGESWWNAIPGIVLNAAVLLYARSPAVRDALDR
jgi:hypothetical protein